MNRGELERAIARGGRALGIDLQDAGRWSPSANLVEELERWSGRINLTAIREREEIVAGHIMDSLAARPLLRGRRIRGRRHRGGISRTPLAW